MGANNTELSHKLWMEYFWNNILIVCQEDTTPRSGVHGLFSNPFYIMDSILTLCLLQYCLIMLAITFTSLLLKPLGFPILSQMAGGVIIMGLLFPNPGPHILLPSTVLYILRNISFIGFCLHAFILGVETNMMVVIKRIGKKSFIICFTGFGCSLLLGFLTYSLLQMFVPEYVDSGSIFLALSQSQNFFGVVCTNVNDLGISNSELGQLATAIAFIVDIFSMVSTSIFSNFVMAITNGNYMLPINILGQYIFLLFILRPILLKIISCTPQGQSMSQNHFMGVLIVVLLATFIGTLGNLYFAVYLLGLSIPQEPLSTFLAEKLDTITSGFLFPIFCAIHGFEANFGYLKDFGRTIVLELLIISGHLGKFLGTLFSSRLFSIPWESAISLAIILTSKGFFDIIIVRLMTQHEQLSVHGYTLNCLHILISTFSLLPLVRKLYEPSDQYSTVFRQNMMTSFDGGSSLHTMFCIFNEENVPGFLHFLEALHPSRSNPIPVVTMQLLQLTGRCSLPIMSTWHQVKSYAALRSHAARCNRVINAYSNLDRKLKGGIRLDHYVSVASYATMHNDICNLAYEKHISLLILPFHVQWTAEGTIDNFSQSIREVNKMVLDKAPCSVAVFIDRKDNDLIQLQLQLQLHVHNHDKYRVVIFYLGGPDDQEALAFCNFFASHPFITLTLLWLYSRDDQEKNVKDCQLIDKYLKGNEGRINFKEVICNDGSATTSFLKTFKDDVDLAVVGKHHDTKTGPLFGLAGEWNEYPELGVLADLLLTAHFNFSILVVQQEPQQRKLPIYDD